MDIILTKDNFTKEVLESDKPILVDFWAAWCGPCKMQNPILEELAKQFEGKIKFGKVDVDANQELATQYGVMSIPTLKIFAKGHIVSEMIGLQNKDKLSEELAKTLQ